EVVRLQLAVARASSEVGDAGRDLGDRLRRRVAQNRRVETLGRVDRDREVLVVGVDDVVAVDRRVDDRVRLERLNGGQREERQEGELLARLREEVVLVLVAE